MTETRVTREEAQALSSGRTRDAATGAVAAGVRPRDFREPRRLSQDGLNTLRKALDRRLASASTALRPWLRDLYAFELEDVTETLFETVLAGVVESAERDSSPVCTARFEFAGQVGWAVWEREAARRSVEFSLGVESIEAGEPAGTDEDETSKPAGLSVVESGIASELLLVVLRELLSAFGPAPAGLEILQTTEALRWSVEDASLAGGAEGARDSQRVYCRLRFDGPGGESSLRLLLPGLVAGTGAPRINELETLPEHLAEVPIEMFAVLDTIDVPLASLLGLEPGDVVPLGARAGDPVHLFIEERECATARLGQHEGMLAVRLEDALEVQRPARTTGRKQGA